MFLLKNTVQEYQWGKRDWLPLFLNKENKQNTPWAELWMGAHSKAPSETEDGSLLNEIIDKDGERILGHQTFEYYGQLPFLFKILAVEEPLSIQVHPSKIQAEEGYARENSLSIPLNAFNRNYKDDNHKPEIICAVEPYTAMKGFRTFEEIRKNFEPLKKLFKVDLFSKNDLSSFYFKLMGLDQSSKETILKGLADCKQDSLEWEWVMKLQNYYPGDISALAPLFLNLVQLKKGEALFLPAGEMHAYLYGVGIELMANSDNVLRGGLTPKNMDLDELKSIVNFEPSPVHILHKNKDDLYPSFADEFILGHGNIVDDYLLELEEEAAILLIFSGEMDIKRDNEAYHLKQGDTLFIEANKINPQIHGRGIIFWARAGKRV